MVFWEANEKFNVSTWDKKKNQFTASFFVQACLEKGVFSQINATQGEKKKLKQTEQPQYSSKITDWWIDYWPINIQRALCDIWKSISNFHFNTVLQE